jgi:hypothetical protein
VSIRLRLALWYGALAGLAVLLVATFTYALHARGHYDDLDQMLVSHADHAAEEYATHAGRDRFTLIEAPSATGVALRLLAADGRILAQTPGSAGAPAAEGLRPGPAFDALAGLSPGFAAVDPAPGSSAWSATRRAAAGGSTRGRSAGSVSGSSRSRRSRRSTGRSTPSAA